PGRAGVHGLFRHVGLRPGPQPSDDFGPAVLSRPAAAHLPGVLARGRPRGPTARLPGGAAVLGRAGTGGPAAAASRGRAGHLPAPRRVDTGLRAVLLRRPRTDAGGGPAPGADRRGRRLAGRGRRRDVPATARPLSGVPGLVRDRPLAADRAVPARGVGDPLEAV